MNFWINEDSCRSAAFAQEHSKNESDRKKKKIPCYLQNYVEVVVR